MPEHPLLRKAKADSKGGFVQHVETTESGDDLKQSDFYDADRTVASFEGGRELHRKSDHPLLRGYKADGD